MNKKVLSYKQLPARFPIWQTATVWLVLDRLQAPGWVWGAIGFFFVMVWIVSIYETLHQEPTELRELSADPDSPRWQLPAVARRKLGEG